MTERHVFRMRRAWYPANENPHIPMVTVTAILRKEISSKSIYPVSLQQYLIALTPEA